MAHEIMANDTMFSTKEVPWHKLGVVLEDYPTIQIALEKANLNWKVSMLPLYAKIIGDQIIEKEVPAQAVYREDTKDILGTVGPDYVPLQNTEAFDIFEPLVESKDLLLETAGSLKNGRRVWILGKINTDPAEVIKGDEIKPYVLLSNSHDGSMAVRLGFTPVRVVCNNTLSMAERSKNSSLIKVVHRSSMQENLKMLRDMLDLTKANFTASINQYRYLAEHGISTEQLEKYVKIMFSPNPQHAFRADDYDKELKRSHKRVIELFETGRGTDLPGMKTWWGCYNAFNSYLVHEKGRSDENRLDSIWFSDGARLNRDALDIAMQMAA